MADLFTNVGGSAGSTYLANHIPAPQNIQGTPMYNVEVGEGNNPPGDFYPASYLPALLSENRVASTVGSWFVLMPGKVITFDTTKRLVPAGYILDKASDAGSRSIKYTANDTVAQTRGIDGLLAAAGDEVVTEALAGGVDFLTEPIGTMRYSSLAAPGTDPGDPSTFYKHAYDTGGAKAFTRWGYLQVPIIEVNARSEALKKGQSDHRIALYDDGSAFVFKAGNTTKTLTKVGFIKNLTAATGSEPTEYAVFGRTVFLNAAVPDETWTITYTPKVDLPFTCLKVDYGTTITTANAKGLADYIGKRVSYNIDSNFQIVGTSGAAAHKVGQILDLKSGSSKELALVRTYFRDFGLWQEAPGSATDGRNAILSIANAPKYIARIAINFNVPNFS